MEHACGSYELEKRKRIKERLRKNTKCTIIDAHCHHHIAVLIVETTPLVFAKRKLILRGDSLKISTLVIAVVR